MRYVDKWGIRAKDRVCEGKARLITINIHTQVSLQIFVPPLIADKLFLIESVNLTMKILASNPAIKYISIL
jgi:hypothetical protein